MKVQINEQHIELPENTTIEQLIKQLDKPLMGSAVAVNQSVVSRSNWSQHVINEGDNISLFQAIAGG